MIQKVLDRVFLLKEKSRLESAHQAFSVYIWIFIIWGLYRFLFRFPIWIEEIFLKGLVFGGIVLFATFIRQKQDLKSLGINLKNFLSAVIFGLSLGVFLLFLGELANFVNYGKLALDPTTASPQAIGSLLALALFTAFWEELLMMGYILNHFKKVWTNEWLQVFVTAILFTLLHLPVMIFSSNLPFSTILMQEFLIFTVGFGNGVIMLRTQNLIAPILTHALWGVSVFLFR